MRFISFLFFILFCSTQTHAEVELGRQGKTPSLIKEVYNVDGSAYLALDDILPALGASGYWHSTQHQYFLNLPNGRASLYPGGPYMKYGRRYIMLDRPARFIDGRLRVAEQVVLNQLADQLPYNIYYRNLAGNSADDRHPPEEQDQFFSFLLHKQFSHNRTNLGGIALDPAHGGDDVGVIGLDGIKEKDVALALALDLQRHIKMQSGTPVYLSRDEDYTLKRSERLGMARENPVDLLLLMHAQAALDPDQSGIHVYVRTRSGGDSPTTFTPGGSMSLALRLSSALRDAGFLVHEVENSALLPIPRGDLPAVLIEFGYLSNASDVQMLTREAERKRLVTALLKGIQAFHNNLESI